MGQAFRRAAAKLRNSSIDTPPLSSSSFPSNNSVNRRPTPPIDRLDIYSNSNAEAGGKSVTDKPGIALEEKDPKFDAMLNQMVGRISSKPGGKMEMGEAFVVEKSNRPLPKLRDTKADTGRYEERPVPLGTLNVAQLRHVLLLHQGKADDHDGPMNIKEIAQRFRVDDLQIQKILQFVSLPPEDVRKQRDDRRY